MALQNKIIVHHCLSKRIVNRAESGFCFIYFRSIDSFRSGGNLSAQNREMFIIRNEKLLPLGFNPKKYEIIIGLQCSHHTTGKIAQRNYDAGQMFRCLEIHVMLNW